MAAGLSGLLRTILVDREKVADFVPVDVVINVMIVAAWKHRTKRGPIHIDDPVLCVHKTRYSFLPCIFLRVIFFSTGVSSAARSKMSNIAERSRC